jgi:hypothetical protein
MKCKNDGGRGNVHIFHLIAEDMNNVVSEWDYCEWLDETSKEHYAVDWISVDERLPEIGKYVIVYNTERATLIGRLMSNGWVAMFADGDNFMGELTAIYWCPEK